MAATPTLSDSDASDILQRTLPTACQLIANLHDEKVALTNELTMDAWEAILNAKQDIAYQVEEMHSSMDDHDSRRSLISALQNLSDTLENALNERLKTSSPPRLYRLSKALELSEKELRAFIFFLFHDNLGGNRERFEKVKDCRAFAGMNFSEFYAFATTDRKHMKEGLICATSEYEESIWSKSVPNAVKKAMFGGSITFDEAMTVSSPTFAAVLAEEPDSIYAKKKDLLKMSALEAEKKKANEPNSVTSILKPAPVNPAEINIDTSRISELLGSLGNGPVPVLPAANVNFENDFLLQDDDKVEAEDDDEDTSAYTDDINYLRDGVQVIIEASDLSSKRLGRENSFRLHMRQRNPDSDLHEAAIKYQRAHTRFKLRLQKTALAGNFKPRLERIVEKLGLSHFERLTIITLIANIVSLKVRGHFQDNIRAMRAHRCLLVSSIIGALCDGDLEMEIAARPNFYKNSRLVSSGLLTLHTDTAADSTDIGEYACVLDRMAFDFIVGLQTELTEIIESARCYTPEVDMETVILPEKMKRRAVERVEHFELFRKFRKEMGFDDIVRYGKGLTLFFHGKSGTGKTLFANALAAYMKQKVLVVDIDSIQAPKDMSESQALRVVFREAQMQNAIVFMDECDALLETRTGGTSSRVAVILREMENFDGIVILATNRPQALDEAMHRRIALSLEFQDPDAKMRHEIWKRHIPKNMELKDDVNLMALAIEFELNGGYIKNAVLEALASAVTRVSNERKALRKEEKEGKEGKEAQEDDEKVACPEVSEISIGMEELRVACHSQSRADMSRTNMQRRIIASSGLDSLIAGEEAMAQLRDVVEVVKVHRILSTRWGFREEQARANCVLIMGPQGCGKTHAAACLGYEVGRPLQTLSMTEILRKGSSAYELSDVFAQAAVAGAVVVIEQGEQLLFEAADVYNNTSQGLELLFNIKSFNGLVIICVTTQSVASDAGWFTHAPIPNRVATLLSYLIKLSNPNREERLRLWKQLIPKSTPKADDVGPSLKKIAAKFDIPGARILACIMRAASSAARRASKIAGSDDAKSAGLVTGKDLEESCEAEQDLVHATNSSAAWVRALYA